MPKFSANLGMLWPELPLLERIAAAGRAGFGAIELHYPYATPPQAVKAACAQAGVRLLNLNTGLGSKPGDFGLAALPGRQTEALGLIDQAFSYAHQAGAKSVHVLAGCVPPTDRTAARDCLIAALRHADAHAADTGVTVLLEAINPFDAPNYFYSRAADVLALLDELASPRLKLMLDFYHLGRTGEDPQSILAAALPHLGHVQIASVPDRAEPDRGTLNFRPILARLDALGYDGWVGCEYHPAADTLAGLAWCERLGVSLQTSASEAPRPTA